MAGPVRIAILANASQANRTFASVSAQANGMGVRVGKAGKFAGLAVAAGLGLAGVAAGKFAMSSVKSASDAQQSIGATETVFGRYAKTVIKRSNDAAKAVGLSANEYRELANVVGASLSGAGVPLAKTAVLTDDLNRRAADMAATFGGTTREAVEAISSLMRGEADPIERYGVSIKAVDVNARLAAKSQGKLTGAALKAAEMQARLDLLMSKTSKTQGAFARESDTLAHQQQVLGAQWENLKATVGSALLPVLTRLLSVVNDQMGPAFSAAAAYVAPFVDWLSGLGSSAGQGNAALGSVSAFLTGTLVPALQRVIGTYQTFYATFIPIIQQVAAAITAKWGQIGPQVQAIWTSVQNIIVSALSIVQSIVKGATALVVALWGKFGATLVKYTANSLGNLVTVLKGAFQIVEGIFKVVSAALRGDWRGVWDGIKKILSGALAVIKGSLSQTWNTVRTITSLAWTALKTIISKAWDGAKAAVKAGISATVQLVTALPKKIIDAIPSPLTMLSDVGKFIVQGLANGIEAAEHWVTDKIKALTDKIPGWVKRRLGIESPSKVMAEIGKWIPAGLALGINDAAQISAVESSINDLTGRVNALFDDRLSTVEKNVKAKAAKIAKALDVKYDAAADKINAKFDAQEKRLKKNLKGKAEDKALKKNESRRDKALERNEKQYNAAATAAEKAARRAQAKIEKQIADQRKRALVLIETTRPALEKLAARHEEIQRSLDAANGELDNLRSNYDSLKQAHDSYAESVKNSIVSFGNVVSLGEGVGYGSVDQMLAKMREKVAKAKEYAALIGDLKAKGLSDTVVQQLVDAGVEGGLGTASAIASGGAAAIEELNSLTSELATTGQTLGAQLADTMASTYNAQALAAAQAAITEKQSYINGLTAEQANVLAAQTTLSAQLDAALAQATALTARAQNEGGKSIGRQLAEGLLEGLDGSKAALEKAAKKMGNALVKKIKQELGIKSPSRVFKSIGDNVVKGLDIGLSDTYVKRSGAVLAASLQKGFGTPALDAYAASGSSTSDLSLTLTLTAEQASDLQQGRDLILKIDTARKAGVRAETF